MVKVLRMAPGDRLMLMDGGGARFQAVIQSATRREVTVRLEKPLPSPPPSPVEIILCQALLKSDPMDYLIQKTSELGVDAIFPFFSQRTIVRLEEERFAHRLRHWNEVGRSAAKQSGRIAPALIAAPAGLEALTAKWRTESGLKAILWEGEGKRDLKALLRDSSRTARFIGIIGPEGGFAREEVEMAEKAGFIPVSLGDRILRAETAAMAMVAVVQYEWGDLGIKGP
jgi:16S rRNA (uracil1498-N3)-methyltransferase